MRSLFLMDDQRTQLNKKEKILYALVVLFLLTFYAPYIPAVNNIVIGGIALFSFFYNSFCEKWILVKQRKELVLMVLFYLLHIISSIFSKNQHKGLAWTIIRM